MFNDFEKSDEGGSPVELYAFSIRAEVFRFTSSEEDVTVGGDEYVAIPIARGSFGQATGDRQDNLVVSVPATLEFARQFVFTPPGAKATLVISRYHSTDPDLEVKVMFRGTLKNVVFADDGRRAEIHVVPVTSVLARQIPRFKYSGLCNHLLYDERCKISDTNPDFEKFLFVSSESSDTITADGASAFGADFFEAGFVEFEDDFRLVVRQTGDDLRLILPFTTSPVGQTVRCLAGCKLRLSDCRTRFNNVENFGGFPWVPLKNPFATGLD